MSSKNNPPDVLEISSSSENELDVESSPLHPCMVPASSRFSFDLGVTYTSTTDDDVTYIKTEGPKTGESSSNPILLTDTTDDELGDDEDDTTQSSLGSQSSAGSQEDAMWLPNHNFLAYVFRYNNISDGSRPYPSRSSSNALSHHHRHLPWHLQHNSFFPNLGLTYIPAGLAIPSIVRQPSISVPPSVFPWQPSESESGSSNGATQKLIEESTTKTRFIKRMPSKIKGKEVKREAPKCAICLEEFVDRVKIRRLRCIHNFHVKCIDAWLKKNMICPICRKPIIAQFHENSLHSFPSTSSSSSPGSSSSGFPGS